MTGHASSGWHTSSEFANPGTPTIIVGRDIPAPKGRLTVTDGTNGPVRRQGCLAAAGLSYLQGDTVTRLPGGEQARPGKLMTKDEATAVLAAALYDIAPR